MDRATSKPVIIVYRGGMDISGREYAWKNSQGVGRSYPLVSGPIKPDKLPSVWN